MEFEVGLVDEAFKSDLDGFKIEYNNDGFTVFVYVQNPSDDDICKLSSSDLKILFYSNLEINKDVGFFVFQFENLGGIAAFSPFLYQEFDFNVNEDLGCFKMRLIIIDSSKGEIKNCSRSVCLDDDFSSWFSDWCKVNSKKFISLEQLMDISRNFICDFSNHKHFDYKCAYGFSK